MKDVEITKEMRETIGLPAPTRGRMRLADAVWLTPWAAGRWYDTAHECSWASARSARVLNKGIPKTANLSAKPSPAGAPRLTHRAAAPDPRLEALEAMQASDDQFAAAAIGDRGPVEAGILTQAFTRAHPTAEDGPHLQGCAVGR